MFIRIQLVHESPRPPRKHRRLRALSFSGLLALALFVPVALASDVFSDVPSSHPFHDQINRTYAAGAFQACGTGLFCPTNSSTRGMLANQYDKLFGLDGNARPFTPTWRGVNIETGGSGPPLTVDSQTKVENLNADQLDGLDSGAFRPVFRQVTGGVGAIDFDAQPVLCPTGVFTPALPTQARLDTWLSARPASSAAMSFGLQNVVSTDGGATWNGLDGSFARAGSDAIDVWAHASQISTLDLAPGTSYRFGVRARRELGTVDAVDSRCESVAEITYRSPASPLGTTKSMGGASAVDE